MFVAMPRGKMFTDYEDPYRHLTYALNSLLVSGKAAGSVLFSQLVQKDTEGLSVSQI